MKDARALGAVLVVIALAIAMGGCATTQQADPLPVDDVEAAELTVLGEIGRSIDIPGVPAVVSYFSGGDVEVPLVTVEVRDRGSEVRLPVKVVPYDGSTLDETDPSVQAAVADGLVALGAVDEDNAEGVAGTVMGYVRTFVIGRSADYFLVEMPSQE
ncbi:MAG: hypothetical protein ACOCYC_03775 [bacterium]